MDHVKRFYELKDTPREQAKYLGQHLQAINSNIKQYLKDEDQKNFQYFYLVTFNLAKKPDAKTLIAIKRYIVDQFQDRPALKITRAVLVMEYTKAGVEHFHVSCSTKIPLSKDRFNYFTKLYGFVDISKNTTKNLNDGLNYIAEDYAPETLVDSL